MKILIEDNGSDIALKNKYGVFYKNVLLSQLKDHHLTVKKLGLLYNLKDYQMVHVLRLLKISYRNPLNDTRILNATISSSQHQLILGTLLGDAFMGHPKRYDLCHGIKQKDYCYHIADKLQNFVASIKEIDTNQNTRAVVLWTYRHDIFLPYFKKFYSKGKNKKYISKKCLEELTEEGLSYWYQDDGKLKKYGAYLCTGKISPKEANTIIKYLKTRFNIKSNPQIWDKKRGYTYIYIPANSREKFFSLIRPYIIPSMEYKTPLTNKKGR